jgi:hypothetical protein
VHFTSFKALLRHNHITELPRQPKDPAWLTRYGRGHRRAP